MSDRVRDFLAVAFRNIDLPPLSAADMGDIGDALERHSQAHAMELRIALADAIEMNRHIVETTGYAEGDWAAAEELDDHRSKWARAVNRMLS